VRLAATNGSQLLYVTPGVLNATEYRAACNCDIDLENYYGKVVTRIDGDSALQWAGDYADSLGIHKDAAIRFNTLMSRSSQFPQFSAALHSLNPFVVASITFVTRYLTLPFSQQRRADVLFRQ
jgi:hypothetical protein